MLGLTDLGSANTATLSQRICCSIVDFYWFCIFYKHKIDVLFDVHCNVRN